MNEISQFHELVKLLEKTKHPVTMSFDSIVSLDKEISELEEALETIRDLARTGSAPEAMNLTPEQWMQHKLNRIAAIASAGLDLSGCVNPLAICAGG